jgi:hypothetical protein
MKRKPRYEDAALTIDDFCDMQFQPRSRNGGNAKKDREDILASRADYLDSIEVEMPVPERIRRNSEECPGDRAEYIRQLDIEYGK